MTDQTAGSVPRIRFKGFDAAWEPKKLGQIYTERNERGNDALPILSVSIHSGISNGELSTETLGKKVRRSEDKSLYKHVQSGDLVLNMMRAWQGGLGVAQVEGMVSPAYLTAAPDDTVYPLFMDCGLRRPQVVAQMNNLSYGVTDFRKRLYWDSFVRVKFASPSVAEQQKIASYFSNLDSVISLHQRKHDKLLALKKAMMQKMFPQPGITTPEIRFKGYSDAWEEKELGGLVAFFKGRGLSKNEIDLSGPEPCIHYGQLFTEYSEEITTVISRASGGKGRFRSIANDVLMPTSDVSPRGLAKASALNQSGVIIGGDILVIRADEKVLLGSFLSRFIRHMESKILQMVSGSTVFHLYSSSMEKFPVRYPSVSEQQKISAYFQSLDVLISKHSAQLKKLKDIKSAYLEEMFI